MIRKGISSHSSYREEEEVIRNSSYYNSETLSSYVSLEQQKSNSSVSPKSPNSKTNFSFAAKTSSFDSPENNTRVPEYRKKKKGYKVNTSATDDEGEGDDDDLGSLNSSFGSNDSPNNILKEPSSPYSLKVKHFSFNRFDSYNDENLGLSRYIMDQSRRQRSKTWLLTFSTLFFGFAIIGTFLFSMASSISPQEPSPVNHMEDDTGASRFQNIPSIEGAHRTSPKAPFHYSNVTWSPDYGPVENFVLTSKRGVEVAIYHWKPSSASSSQQKKKAKKLKLKENRTDIGNEKNDENQILPKFTEEGKESVEGEKQGQRKEHEGRSQKKEKEESQLPYKGAVLAVHGLNSHSGFQWLTHYKSGEINTRGFYYEDSIVEYVTETLGMDFYAFDLEGHGFSEDPKESFHPMIMKESLYHILEEDMISIIRWIRLRHNIKDPTNKSIFLLGHSAGGLLITRFVQDFQDILSVILSRVSSSLDEDEKESLLGEDHECSLEDVNNSRTLIISPTANYSNLNPSLLTKDFIPISPLPISKSLNADIEFGNDEFGGIISMAPAYGLREVTHDSFAIYFFHYLGKLISKFISPRLLLKSGYISEEKDKKERDVPLEVVEKSISSGQLVETWVQCDKEADPLVHAPFSPVYSNFVADVTQEILNLFNAQKLINQRNSRMLTQLKISQDSVSTSASSFFPWINPLLIIHSEHDYTTSHYSSKIFYEGYCENSSPGSESNAKEDKIEKSSSSKLNEEYKDYCDSRRIFHSFKYEDYVLHNPILEESSREESKELIYSFLKTFNDRLKE